MAVPCMRWGTILDGSRLSLAWPVHLHHMPGTAETRGGTESAMTLLELSAEYRAHAQALDGRIGQLRCRMQLVEDDSQRCQLQERIHMLSTMLREARELAVLTERYYDRGYRRNAKYTI